MLERLDGAAGARAALARAGLVAAPAGDAMIPEDDAARLHQLLRRERPEEAPALSAEAGRRTAGYILAHRIPRAAQALLRLSPAGLAARGLSAAIARHAWTFAGSGAFRVVDPWTFEIAGNPMIRGEASAAPLCHWHAAVFERLYRTLVHPDCRCREAACGAQHGGDSCRFEMRRERRGD